MNWDKLKKNHYHDQPVEHIIAMDLIDSLKYDSLYENQNNLDHQHWKEFCEKYNTTAELKEDFSDIDFSKDIMCLWFFKERSDSTAAYVHLKGKQIRYEANTFLISKSKDIKFVHTTRKYIRSPLVQLDIDGTTYDDLLRRINKVT